MNEIQRIDPGEVDMQRPQTGELSIERAFQAILSGDIDAGKLAVLKDLLAMDAEKKFNAAFVLLQSELPVIQGYRGIPDKSGNIKFKYANFEDIDAIIRPLCLKNGFSYSFRETSHEGGKITTTMTLRHARGHMVEVPCTTRIGSGPPGTSEQQCDAGAHTYGKRGALELGLSLRIVGARDDAGNEGDTSKKVTLAQADELERRSKMLNSNIPKFLEFARAKSFADIAANRYDEIDQMLRRKEQGSR